MLLAARGSGLVKGLLEGEPFAWTVLVTAIVLVALPFVVEWRVNKKRRAADPNAEPYTMPEWQSRLIMVVGMAAVVGGWIYMDIASRG